MLRLPGTVNWPNKAKRAKGRSARLAAVVRALGGKHPLADFPPVPLGQPTGGGTVELPADLPPADVEALPAHVDARTRMLIVQGEDPDDPTRYGSKSEVMWAVVNTLIRAGCDAELIAAFLLDPQLGISDHPLRQKRSVEYVARQIERAREENENPMLRQLNEEHAVVDMYGGKCRVVSWQGSEADPTRQELVAQSFEDFRNRYMNIRVQAGQDKQGQPTYAPAGKWWLEHPMRRQFRSVVFQRAPSVMGGI